MGVVGFLAVSASAQNPPATTRVRLAGTIEKLDGHNLTIKTTEDQAVTVTLSTDVAIFGVEKRSVADIKPGDFLASGGVKGGDGKIHAIEVRILPEALRGVGEGQRPWVAKPDGVMTNATVGYVTQSPKAGVIHVTFKDGQSEFVVGPEVPVLAYVAGDRGLLKPGSAVVTVAQRKPDGTLASGRVTAEKNGVKPPM
jgi:hypothetical protein